MRVKDVRRVCRSLPGVSERTSWGQPAWYTCTRVAPSRMGDDGVLTVKATERNALAAQDLDTYFWTAHHDRSPLLLLVHLGRLDDPTLQELLARVLQACLVASPPGPGWPASRRTGR